MKERERIASNMIDKKYCFLWLVSAPPPFSTSFFSQVHWKKKVRSVVHLVTHACMWDVPIRKHLLTAHTCPNSSWPRDSYRLTAGRGCLMQYNLFLTLHGSHTEALFHTMMFGYFAQPPSCAAEHLRQPHVDFQGLWPVPVSVLRLFLVHNCPPSPLYCAHHLCINTPRKIKGLWWQHSWVYGSFHTHRCYLKHRPTRIKTLELKGTFTCDEFRLLLNPHRNCGWWAGTGPCLSPWI